MAWGAATAWFGGRRADARAPGRQFAMLSVRMCGRDNRTSALRHERLDDGAAGSQVPGRRVKCRRSRR